MTTPFKSLQPTTPRYIEIDYVAPAGECCSGFSSSSSGGGGVTPDIPVPANEYLLNLTEYPSDGSAFMGAAGINVYTYDGVGALTFLRQINYIELGAIIDLTETIVDGWGSSSESVVLTAYYNFYGVESEVPLTPSFTSYSGVSIGAVTGVSGNNSGPFDSAVIEIQSVLLGSFLATVDEILA